MCEGFACRVRGVRLVCRVAVWSGVAVRDVSRVGP